MYSCASAAYLNDDEETAQNYYTYFVDRPTKFYRDKFPMIS